MYISADFETTVLPPETTAKDVGQNPDFACEVWLSCFCEVGKHEDEKNYKVQTDIKQFFKELIIYCEENNPNKDTFIFFHNLKFDGSYIMNLLLRNNIEATYFIDEMGMWFTIEVETDNATLVFKDSLKVLNFSLEVLSKNILGKYHKGETPLLENKPEIIKPEWMEYMINDVRILCYGIDEMYNRRDFVKFTSASEALHEYKKTIDFENHFPVLSYDEDKEIRKGYKGAWTYVKEDIKEIPIEQEIEVYDENSKYPSIMLKHPLPYGYPETFDKFVEPQENECSVHKVKINFDLRKGFLPTIQAQSLLQAVSLGVRSTTYLKSTQEIPEWFVLTNYDLKQLKKHYHVEIYDCEWTKIFKTKKGMFSKYVHKYQEEKEYFKSVSDNFGVLKAKIMLNSLYGKFGAKTESRTKSLFLEDGVLKFKTEELKIEKPIYLPIAMFITSIGRYEIIEDAQNNYDNFLYSDTDSLHVLKSDNIKLDIHPSNFGCWDLEKRCIYGLYLRSKLNLEIEYNSKRKISEYELLQLKNFNNNNSKKVKGYLTTKPFYSLSVTGAGMTKDVKKLVTKENFKIGFEKENCKKTLRQVKGGIAIVLTDFKINEHLEVI